MLSTGSEQQGQNTRVRTVFLTLTKTLDLLVFFHQVCKNETSVRRILVELASKVSTYLELIYLHKADVVLCGGRKTSHSTFL